MRRGFAALALLTQFTTRSRPGRAEKVETMRMVTRFLAILFASLLLPATLPVSAIAQDAETLRERVNRGTVGVISGGVNGTYIRITSDLSAVLDAEDLRILSILGKGSVQNIADLLYLRGIDIAVVQSDVLEFLRRQRTYPNIGVRINYITKLYNEEIHLLVRSDINDINELSGKKVNFDREGSGTAMTASIVFDTIGVDVEPSYLDQSAALDALRSGEISGLVYVAGQPVQLFGNLTADDGLKFLPIGFTPDLLATYLPAKLTGESYPGLIDPASPVSTVAVGAVMAAYNWDEGHVRYDKVARFVDRFFDNFDEFQKPARHRKWQEVSLSAEVPGWARLLPAQKWLDSNN